MQSCSRCHCHSHGNARTVKTRRRAVTRHMRERRVWYPGLALGMQFPRVWKTGCGSRPGPKSHSKKKNGFRICFCQAWLARAQRAYAREGACMKPCTLSGERPKRPWAETIGSSDPTTDPVRFPWQLALAPALARARLRRFSAFFFGIYYLVVVSIYHIKQSATPSVSDEASGGGLPVLQPPLRP
jgi:hypothetical protein